jgi:hypothetical protein
LQLSVDFLNKPAKFLPPLLEIIEHIVACAGRAQQDNIAAD